MSAAVARLSITLEAAKRLAANGAFDPPGPDQPWRRIDVHPGAVDAVLKEFQRSGVQHFVLDGVVWVDRAQS